MSADAKSMARPLPTSQIFIFRKGASREGPYTPEEIGQRLAARLLTPSDLAWYEGVEDWVPVLSLWKLLPLPASLPPPPPALRAPPVVIQPPREPEPEVSWRDIAEKNRRTPISRANNSTSLGKTASGTPSHPSNRRWVWKMLGTLLLASGTAAAMTAQAAGVFLGHVPGLSSMNPVLTYADSLLPVLPLPRAWYLSIETSVIRRKFPDHLASAEFKQLEIANANELTYRFAIANITTPDRLSVVLSAPGVSAALSAYCASDSAGRLAAHGIAVKQVFAAKNGKEILSVPVTPDRCGRG